MPNLCTTCAQGKSWSYHILCVCFSIKMRVLCCRLCVCVCLNQLRQLAAWEYLQAHDKIMSSRTHKTTYLMRSCLVMCFSGLDQIWALWQMITELPPGGGGDIGTRNYSSVTLCHPGFGHWRMMTELSPRGRGDIGTRNQFWVTQKSGLVRKPCKNCIKKAWIRDLRQVTVG